MPYRLIKSADRYRGTFLFLAGLMFLVQAVSYLLSPAPMNALPGLHWMPEVIMLWQAGLVLTVTSVFAASVGLLSKRLHKHVKVISYGYLAAMVAPLLQVTLGAWAIMHGAYEWLPSMPTHVVLAAMIYLASEWPNPTPPTWPIPLPPSREEDE